MKIGRRHKQILPGKDRSEDGLSACPEHPPFIANFHVASCAFFYHRVFIAYPNYRPYSSNKNRAKHSTGTLPIVGVAQKQTLKNNRLMDIIRRFLTRPFLHTSTPIIVYFNAAYGEELDGDDYSLMNIAGTRIRYLKNLHRKNVWP
jgi:hypothetical protein